MGCIGLSPIPNQLKQSKIVWGPTQKVITIAYAVPDLSSGPSTLEDAISALSLTQGTPCPLDSNCLLTNFESTSFEGKADTVAEVIVSYTGFDYYGSPTQDDDGHNLSYTYAEALNQDQTNFNIADKNTPLKVYFWLNPANIGNKANQAQVQGCTIPVLKAYTTKTVRYFYNATDFPDSNITELQGYVGQYNTDTWDSGSEKTWLVTGVTATCVGLAQQLLIEITFMYKPETWLQWSFFRDTQNGGSPDGAHKDVNDPNQNTTSNGAAGFLPYTGISFSSSFGFD